MNKSRLGLSSIGKEPLALIGGCLALMLLAAAFLSGLGLGLARAG